MKCLECGKELKAISFFHLTSKNCTGLTPQKYKEKYPEAKLMNEETINKCKHIGKDNGMFGKKRSISFKKRNSKIIKQRMKDPAIRYKCGANRGKTLEEILGKERAMKRRKILSEQTGEKNPFYGKKHTKKTKKKMKENQVHRIGSKNSFYGKHHSDETKQNLSELRKKEWNGLSKNKRIKRIEKWIKSGQDSNKNNKHTKIEQIISKCLDTLNVPYFWIKELNGKWVDFLINEKIIIECYGQYWHCDPRYYKPDYYHAKLHMLAKEKWEIDRKRKDMYEKLGYRYIVLWEKDIYDQEINLTEKIQTIIGETNV